MKSLFSILPQAFLYSLAVYVDLGHNYSFADAVSKLRKQHQSVAVLAESSWSCWKQGSEISEL